MWEQNTHSTEQLSVLEEENSRFARTGRSLCIRQWENKPYRSKQEAILEVPATIVDVQKVVITQPSINSLLPVNVDGREVPISEIAKNDGLSSTDFAEFFKPILKASGEEALTFAIIHFTTFRY